MRLHSFNEVLASRTTFHLGGPARILIEADTEEDIIKTLEELGDTPCFVLGGGSNLLISDTGYSGTVLAIRNRGVWLFRDGEGVVVRAAAGESWDELVARCVEEGLSGIECLSGIPGLVGATPIQNVGAYGQEVSDTLLSLRAYDRREQKVVEISAGECSFSYRNSIFKSRWPGRFVVLSVDFRLRAGPPQALRYAELAAALEGGSLTSSAIRSRVIELRQKKGMVFDREDPDTWSAGSFFTNPILDAAQWRGLQIRVAPRLKEGERIPSFDGGEGRTKVAAAWLIERAGFSRGTSRGKAAISPRHALALINRGGTASEIVALAQEIQRRVHQEFGINLDPEPVLLGFPEGDR